MFVTRPDGCRLYVETHGDDAAPPILLLEGMGGDLPGWRRSIPVLARSLRVIAYDHRGNGRSDEPHPGDTMDTFADDAVGVLAALGVDRAHLYGMSFGGMVAQEVALRHPSQVRTLILAATHAGVAHQVVAPRDAVPIHEPWRALYAPGFPDAHPEHVADDLRAGASQPQHPGGGRTQWDVIRSWSSYERLPMIVAPTLVLQGTQDRLVAPGNAEVLASRIPGAELAWLKGAGHLAHSEQQEVTDAAVLGFIGRHPDA
jgi:pimeloyl-ACP methyl ester carboxylesterase